MSKRVAVFGLGYVGTVTAACLSRDGHRVVGVDIDASKTTAINDGESPVAEPGLSEVVAEQVRDGRLRATLSGEDAVRETEMALVAVGTPSDARGDINLGAVVGVIEDIGRTLHRSSQEYVVVIRSTLLPHTLDEVIAPALEAACGEPLGGRIHLCNNPEFLREASALLDYDSPPFVIVGADDETAAQEVLSLYSQIPAPQIVTDTRTAALVKYACNAFHATKVAFANEIGILAKAMGADGREVMDILCRDERLNISPAYLRPGFAFGGSCLPKDLRALTRFAQQQAIPANVLSAVLPSNDAILARGVEMIEEQADSRRRIGLVGLSFKAGTDDLRESPLVRLAEVLIGRGYDLRIYDPGVRTGCLRGRNLAYVDQHLPHLAALLVDERNDLYIHSEVLVLGTGVAKHIDWQQAFAGEVVDLRQDLVKPQRQPVLV